jgi:hypothetical protein
MAKLENEIIWLGLQMLDQSYKRIRMENFWKHGLHMTWTQVENISLLFGQATTI